jgi:hypothetical protein
MRVNNTHSSMLISPARTIVGKVEHYKSSTLLNTFKHTDAISNFKVTRTAAKKYFGFGVTQQLELKLVDKERAITVSGEDLLTVSFGVDENYFYPYPSFTVSEVTRDENSNQLTIKANDLILANADKHKIQEITETMAFPIQLQDAARACAQLIGCSEIVLINTGTSFNLELDAINVDGEETIRAVLDDIAEATQTIYYQSGNNLVFKRLDKVGTAALTIRKADYFTLSSQPSRTLRALGAITELGDNLLAESGDGDTQYIRDNAIWGVRDDINTLLNDALTAVGGTTMYPFSCKWRGNYLLEIGDKIALVTKDDKTITNYLLEEQLTYNGGINCTCSWEFVSDSKENTNPSTIGEIINQTSAKVDKANKRIELVVSETAANADKISELEMSTSGISASVSALQENVRNETDMLQEEISTVRNEVEMKIDSNQLNIAISTELANGVNQVTTATGYKFNSDGLTISRSDSEITTTITQDGMSIKRGYDQVLSANNEGVSAEDLHATTYLIIGKTSRFEDYTDGYKKRTGCFWIGG